MCEYQNKLSIYTPGGRKDIGCPRQRWEVETRTGRFPTRCNTDADRDNNEAGKDDDGIPKKYVV
jgi:hypothetical protein